MFIDNGDDKPCPLAFDERSKTDEEEVEEMMTFALEVDPQQEWKAKELKLCSFARPHMRAFHYSWLSCFMAFFVWFSIAPLLPVIKESLGLSSKDIWLSNIIAISSDFVMRPVFGSLSDKMGSRLLIGGVLLATSIPTACTGLVNNLVGLCLLRLFIGLAGPSFILCQCWTTRMFTREIVGTANALVGGWGGAGAFTQIIMGTALFPLFRDIVFAEAEDPVERAWRTICVVPAILAFMTGVIVILTSDDCPEGNYKQLVKNKKKKRVSATNSFVQGAFDFNTWLLFIHYGCSFGVELTMQNAAATYFVDHFDLSISSAAAITSIFGIVSLFARALGGFCSDWANRKMGMKGQIWVQLMFLLCEGICILFFPLMHSLWSSILLFGILSVLTLCAQGSTYGIVPYVNPTSPGAVAGMVGGGGSSVAVAFGLGFMYFEKSEHAYFLMGGLVIVGAASCLLLKIEGPGGNVSHKERILSSTSRLATIRPEYVKSMQDFDYLLNGTKRITMDYYEKCGTPSVQVITKYAMPEDIFRELGTITNKGSSNDECLRNINTVFEYSVKNLSPYYLDKLGQSSDPIGQIADVVTAVVNNNAHVYRGVALRFIRRCITDKE